ncbi:hypothetical protein Agub_g6174 [Astrephomene gubernaculifera]|uniref:SAM domain-containing protein n=1 Tax=Astrephomene gubernaculifera TaxID=47775 RepID=A0AAD3DNF7_9CHLO|nr:hypothetical protein Agub_g6174 [Astrephomene gubernaculifera]
MVITDSNLFNSQVDDDDAVISYEGNEANPAHSERPGRTGASQQRDFQDDGSGLGGLDDEVSENFSSSTLMLDGKPRSTHSRVPSQRAPSNASGRGGGNRSDFGDDLPGDGDSKLPSEAVAGHSPHHNAAGGESYAADDVLGATVSSSIALSESALEHPGKPASRRAPSAAPSSKAPSEAGAGRNTRTGIAAGGNSQSSEIVLGESALDDGPADAASERRGKPSSHRAPSTAAGSTRGGGAGGSEAGGALSARSSFVGGDTYSIDFDGAAASEAPATAPSPPVRRRSSLASSLRQSVASQKSLSSPGPPPPAAAGTAASPAGGGSEQHQQHGVAAAAADASLSYSIALDDTASVRSGAAAPPAAASRRTSGSHSPAVQPPAAAHSPAAALPAGFGAAGSVRSGRSAAASSSIIRSAGTTATGAAESHADYNQSSDSVEAGAEAEAGGDAASARSGSRRSGNATPPRAGPGSAHSASVRSAHSAAAHVPSPHTPAVAAAATAGRPGSDGSDYDQSGDGFEDEPLDDDSEEEEVASRRSAPASAHGKAGGSGAVASASAIRGTAPSVSGYSARSANTARSAGGARMSGTYSQGTGAFEDEPLTDEPAESVFAASENAVPHGSKRASGSVLGTPRAPSTSGVSVSSRRTGRSTIMAMAASEHPSGGGDHLRHPHADEAYPGGPGEGFLAPGYDSVGDVGEPSVAWQAPASESGQSTVNAGGGGGGGAAGGGGGSSGAAGASASMSGSIFQPEPTSASAAARNRRPGSAVFRRLPADAGADSNTAHPHHHHHHGNNDPHHHHHRASSARSSAADDSASGLFGLEEEDDWNEGAIRVAAPGVQQRQQRLDRPASASPRDLRASAVEGLPRKHPASWDCVEVANWVEFLGLGQYRRRFLHHYIDGRLLLQLSDAQLKTELGIAPAVHRRAILDSAGALLRQFHESQRERMLAASYHEHASNPHASVTVTTTSVSPGRGESPGRSAAAAGYTDDSVGGNTRREYVRPGSAPRAAARARTRPASALPGGAVEASPRAAGAQGSPAARRRPSSASRAAPLVPPDAYLGPAMGKVTAYEQRSKLLFELDRAQARAEQHRVLAEQLQHKAQLSAKDVARARGALLDNEHKNKGAFGLMMGAAVAGGGPGSVGLMMGGKDNKSFIPWCPVGKRTTNMNWHPERFARPGEPDTVDLTFQPRCTNAESKKLLGERGGSPGGGRGGSPGGGAGEGADQSAVVNGFLERLNNDLRKREQSRKELTRRYWSEGSGAAAAKQAEADWKLVSEALSSRCKMDMGSEPAEYEGQIDEAMSKLSTSESWREAGLRDGPIKAAKGPAKVAAAAAALRSLSFMERYRSDLKSKDRKLKDLERKWLSQTLGTQYLPSAKDKEDLEQAVQFFALLGWRDDDGSPAEAAVQPYLLDRLLERAIAYRKQYDRWWQRVRDRPEERAAGFHCEIDWTLPPWDTDGLAAPMEEEMERMALAAEAAAASGAGGTLTQYGTGFAAVDVAPVAPGPGPSSRGGQQHPQLRASSAAAGAGVMDFVDFTVRLLGRAHLEDLHKLMTLAERQKRLGVYRAIRTQKFIEFTQRDMEERNRKLRHAYATLAPARRKVPSSRIEAFFERLAEDAARRRARAERLAHDKVAKEAAILASSVIYGRPRSAR